MKLKRERPANVATWSDALNAREEYRLWLRTEPARLYLKGFQQSIREKEGRDMNTALVAKMTNRGPLYWVADEAQALIEHAADSMELEEFHREDLPSPSGFVVLVEPIFFPDARGKTVNMGAFAWALQEVGERTGLALVLFRNETARDDLMDEIPPEVAASFKPPGLLPLAFQAHWTGTPIGLPDDAPGLGCYKFLKAFWAFCHQKIITRERQRPPRPTRRRAEKEGMEPPEEVVVVRLRRALQRAKKEEPGTVDWSHRWLVHGFWRRQWYPSIGTHRQRWIEDFVKGPADKPLILKDQVFRVDR